MKLGRAATEAKVSGLDQETLGFADIELVAGARAKNGYAFFSFGGRDSYFTKQR